jgi:hypothetical protein
LRVSSSGDVRERLEGIDGVQRYLDEVEKDLVAHAEEFMGTTISVKAA